MSTSSDVLERLGPGLLDAMFEAGTQGLALVGPERSVLHVNTAGCALLGRDAGDLVGRDLATAVAPPTAAEFSAWFEERVRGPADAPVARSARDFEVEKPDGTRCTVSFTSAVLPPNARAVLLAFHDVTGVRRAEKEAAALRSVAAALATGTSANDIARRLAEEVVRLGPAHASAVILLSGEPLRGRVAGSSGLSRGFVHALESSLLVDPAELEERMPGAHEVRVIEGLQERYRRPDTRDLFSPVIADARWETLACLPLTYLGERTGALFAYFAGSQAPTQADLAFLGDVAAQSVVAVQNARLLAEVQDLAALEERQRLARELHDSVSQALYGIALGTRSARSQLGRNPERVAERLDYVMKMAEAAVSEMRTLIFELRPEVLEADGLVVAVSKHAEAMRARHSIELQTLLGDEPPLAFVEKQALYRIAQEALHNIVKHAQARSVKLELAQRDGRVVLVVQDDGVGFDAEADHLGHFGLRSMRERAEALGGVFQISSSLGRGSVVRVELPLRAQADDPSR